MDGAGGSNAMRRIGWTWMLVVLLAGCAATGAQRTVATAALEGDAARPAQASDWQRSELYFGVGGEDGSDVIDETRWRAFLDAQVTTRFPDGLTVFDAYGQWLFRGDPAPNRLRTKVLVILHENTPQRRADIEAIRLAWKQATGHQSVLWVAQPAEVSF